MIKCSELPVVVEGCHQHILQLQKTCQFLCDNQKYQESIALAIIAHEEMGRFAIYSHYRRKEEDLPEQIEKNLFRHDFKLTRLIRLDKERCETSVGKLLNSTNTIDIPYDKLSSSMKKLNVVKQLALYYDYRSKPITLRNHAAFGITKKSLGCFCRALLLILELYVEVEVARNRHGDCDGNMSIMEMKKDAHTNEKFNRLVHEFSRNQDVIKTGLEVFEKLIRFMDECGNVHKFSGGNPRESV